MFILAVWLLTLLTIVHGCTDIIINDQKCNGSIVSGRTMSFPAELGPYVTAGPPGAALGLLDIAEGTPPLLKQPFTTRRLNVPAAAAEGSSKPSSTASKSASSIPILHGFVCISHLPSALKQLFPPSDPIMQPNHAVCVDGMNSKGLSIAVLYQENTRSMPVFSTASHKSLAINFLDLPAFLLARYASVADAEQDLSAHMQVVWNPQYSALGQLVSFGTQDAPPLHLTVHDATGASLVVQFREGEMQVLRNPLGVFTNSPFLQEQSQYYENWLRAYNYTKMQKLNGQKWVMPGDYSSPSRFTRLAMLKSATLGECWPIKVQGELQLLSPGYTPAGYPPANPTLLAVMGILQSVYLPRGVDDDGQADSALLSDLEVTPYTTLRDHQSAVYFYRTGNSATYRSVALRSAAWSMAGGAITHKHLVPPQQPWATDDTSSLFTH